MPGGEAPRVLPLTKPAVSLIVSDVPADRYSTGAIEARLSDLDWVTRAGTAHHAVADALVATHTVIPFRLFTLFSSDEKVLSTLGRRAKAIDSALARVAGKAEWVLKVSKPTSASTTSLDPGTSAATGTSFLQRKAAAKQAAVESVKRIRAEAAGAYEALAALATDSFLRDVEAVPGLLLDASFLVPARKVAAVKRELSRAAAGLLEAGCRVSFTGPWPPYSFVALEPHSPSTRSRSLRTGRG